MPAFAGIYLHGIKKTFKLIYYTKLFNYSFLVNYQLILDVKISSKLKKTKNQTLLVFITPFIEL